MKANLVVHPDKVKQKGGTLEQVRHGGLQGSAACWAVEWGGRRGAHRVTAVTVCEDTTQLIRFAYVCCRWPSPT